MAQKATELEYVPNYYVTEHFMYSDFMCPCCDILKLTPGFYTHVSRLEKMSDNLGFALTVTSGYRCKAHNTSVCGAPRSWHLLFATDVQPQDEDPDKLRALYEMAIDLRFGGIGLYDKHVHLDLRPEPARWRQAG